MGNKLNKWLDEEEKNFVQSINDPSGHIIPHGIPILPTNDKSQRQKWIALFSVLFSVLFERIAFYGFVFNISVFLEKQLWAPWTEKNGTNALLLFSGRIVKNVSISKKHIDLMNLIFCCFFFKELVIFPHSYSLWLVMQNFIVQQWYI